MQVQSCWDLASLKQFLEESTHGSGQESYFQGLIYLQGQVFMIFAFDATKQRMFKLN